MGQSFADFGADAFPAAQAEEAQLISAVNAIAPGVQVIAPRPGYTPRLRTGLLSAGAGPSPSAVLQSCVAAYRNAVLARAGLLAYWPCGDAASPLTDAGPNAVNSVATFGAPVFGAPRMIAPAGVLDSAGSITFGGGDGFDMGNPAALDMTYDQFTTSLWINSPGAGGDQAMLTKTDGALAFAAILQQLSAGNATPTLCIVDTSPALYCLDAGIVVADGTPHFCVFTFDKADAIRCYVDGVAAGVLPVGGFPIRQSVVDWAIASTSDAMRGLTGSLSQIAIWNNVMTPAEALAFYVLGTNAALSQKPMLPATSLGVPVVLPAFSPLSFPGLAGGDVEIEADNATPVSASVEVMWTED
jgi:hypothetical protein